MMLFCIGIIIAYTTFKVKSLDTVSDISTIVVVAGEQAIIPCNVTTPLKDDEASLILWYRLDKPDPIYTLDIRKVLMQNARRFPSSEIRERVNFDIDVHPPVLKFSPTVPEDEADYKCRVDLRRSRTLILQTRLIVIVPPDDPIIMDAHGQRLVDIIGPYDEGATITFICDVDGGKPTPSVTWWREDSLVDANFNVPRKGFVRNKLVLPEIGRSELMANYSCRASNTNLTNPKLAAIQLDMNLLPLDVYIDAPESPLLSGEVYALKCIATGSKPAAITSWWIDNLKITSGTHEILNETDYITENDLKFIPTIEDDGKALTCKAANPAIPKSTIQTVFFIQVHYFPVLNLVLSTRSNESSVKEGDDVFMSCQVKANPWIFSLSWEFEQNILQPNISSGIIIGNQTLWLKRAKREHNGTYRCWASNAIGRASSNFLHLIVHFAPVCKSSEPETYALGSRESANLTCDTEAYPDVYSYRWTFNNSTGPTVLKEWGKHETWNTLNYFLKSLSDFGTIYCWSRNSVGIQKNPCQFNIILARAPDSPRGCVLSNQTMSLVSVICEPGYNGGLQQVFHLELYNSITEVFVRNHTEWVKPTFEIDNLLPSTSYLLIIYSSNSKGKSKSVALVATTLSPAERRTAQENTIDMNILIPILFGAAAVLLIITVIIGFVIVVHKLKHNRRKGSVIQDVSNECQGMKKDLEVEIQEPNEKGPDIIPQTIEADVFFMSGKMEDVPGSSALESSPTTYVHRKFKHTAL